MGRTVIVPGREMDSTRAVGSSSPLSESQLLSKFGWVIILPLECGDSKSSGMKTRPSRSGSQENGIRHGSWIAGIQTTRRRMSRGFLDEWNIRLEVRPRMCHRGGRTGFEPVKPCTPHRQSSVIPDCLKWNDEVFAGDIYVLCH